MTTQAYSASPLDIPVRGDLLPCPFCGQESAVELIDSDTFREMQPWEEDDEGNMIYWSVMCDASKPNGKGGCGASGGFMPTKEQAIERWNIRAPNAEVNGGRLADRPSEAV